MCLLLWLINPNVCDLDVCNLNICDLDVCDLDVCDLDVCDLVHLITHTKGPACLQTKISGILLCYIFVILFIDNKEMYKRGEGELRCAYSHG